ncbi:SDR family oxidoreductase [Mycobacterium kubicae]|uniref:SDR family oxidoreductase n=1 Tax=Mycobacterium kubicae TaxID=120959 RepID=UPI001F6084CF|nr:SDR family oxidoreductase [Mycobacterium kubicae]
MSTSARMKPTLNPARRPAAVVTGTSSGIGRACALGLAGEGYHVFAGVRRRQHGQALVQEASRNGGQLTPVIMDVTDEASIRTAAAEVADSVGDAGVAVLVNNAGIGMTWPVEAVPLADLRHIYEVNVFGQVAVTQAFLPLIRACAGRVVNVGSIGDRLSLPFGAPLVSSKWAFASITESLRMELRPWGIHVVLIEPATIQTDAVKKVKEDAERVMSKMTPADLELYGETYQAMTRKAIERASSGSDPDVVARAVLRAARKKRPRTRYVVGKDGRLLAFLAGWAPDRLFDAMRVRLFGLPKKFGAAAQPVNGVAR